MDVILGFCWLSHVVLRVVCWSLTIETVTVDSAVQDLNKRTNETRGDRPARQPLATFNNRNHVIRNRAINARWTTPHYVVR